MINISTLKELSIDGIKLVELSINGVLAWKNSFKNWVKFSTEADGETIYNGGLGYKSYSRLSVSGLVEEARPASHTGFIPVNSGDVIRLSGWDFSYRSSSNAINVFRSDFAVQGQFVSLNYNYGVFGDNEYPDYGFSSVVEERAGVWKWVVPPADSYVAYIRVSGYTNDGWKMIVTINEEILP